MSLTCLFLRMKTELLYLSSKYTQVHKSNTDTKLFKFNYFVRFPHYFKIWPMKSQFRSKWYDCLTNDKRTLFFRSRMYHASVLALTTIVALSVQIQVGVWIGTDGRNDIIRFIYTHIPKLQRQAESVQFAALFLLTEQEVLDHTKFHFIPHDKNKRPLVNNRCYYCPDNQ